MNKKQKAVGPGKFPTGIAGFDDLTGGGLAANRTTLVLGGSGTGKTVFALQALLAGARRGEPGIFVSFDEHPRQLVENGASFGWDLAELQQKKLVFLNARMRPGAITEEQFDLLGMLAGLRAVATEIGAKRIVFDSIDVMLALLAPHAVEMQEIFRLRDWLFENEFTGILTANLQGCDPGVAQPYPYLQFIADCTVALECRLRDGIASRYLRVVKYRGSAFIEKEFPFAIGTSGIEVLTPSHSEAASLPASSPALGQEIELARKELSARIQALDRFLEMKQAELDFLMEKESSLPAEPAPPAVKPGKKQARMSIPAPSISKAPR